LDGPAYLREKGGALASMARRRLAQRDRAALRKGGGSIFGVLRLRGGIAPATLQRSRLALTSDEREKISRGLSAGESIRTIAARIKRAPSTISREIQRNGGASHYRAGDAEERTWDRARRPKKCRLATHGKLRLIVANKLRMQWSPHFILL